MKYTESKLTASKRLILYYDNLMEQKKNFCCYEKPLFDVNHCTKVYGTFTQRMKSFYRCGFCPSIFDKIN